MFVLASTSGSAVSLTGAAMLSVALLSATAMLSPAVAGDTEPKSGSVLLLAGSLVGDVSTGASFDGSVAAFFADGLSTAGLAALGSTAVDFVFEDFAVLAFAESDFVVPAVFAPVVLAPAVLAPVVLELAVFAPVVLAPVDLAPAAAFFAVDSEPPELTAADPVSFLAGEALAAGISFFAGLSVDAPVEAPALGLRRREDCIEAAGSVRAARGAFGSSALCLASSGSPPEKNTSTGRSLDAASGIKAPNPRPSPRFLRSATIYSSLCDFFGGFLIGQSATGMGVVRNHRLAVTRRL